MDSKDLKKSNSISEPEWDKDDIETVLVLANDLSKLYTDVYRNEEFFSDVIFCLENGERVPAHRLILAARSEYFKAMLYGGLAEARQNEVRIKAPVEAFKMVLKFLYSGHLLLDPFDIETCVKILSLAHQYDIESLQVKVAQHLEKNLTLENVGAILDWANLFDLQALTEQCLQFMDRHADILLDHEIALNFSRTLLCILLRRDSFYAPEIEIFRLVKRWLEYNPEEQSNAKEITSVVRLPLLTQDQLLDEVKPSGVFELEDIFEAISTKRNPQKLVERRADFGLQVMNENVVQRKFGARVIKGMNRNDLLSENTNGGYTYQEKNDRDGIVVELGNTYLINHIRMKLLGKNNNYFIEISIDQKDWTRIIDYNFYRCQGWQILYFEKCPVRYIRLFATFSLQIVCLEAKNVQNIPKMIDQFVQPTENVATLELGATMLESSLDNVLLNGILDYTPTTGFASSNILQRESITIQLTQPYYIGSMRLLLYSLDNQKFKFYVETSTNGNIWDIVLDRRVFYVNSWVNVSFEPKLMLYIRIVGTGNSESSNEPFKIVHFECPSQVPGIE